MHLPWSYFATISVVFAIFVPTIAISLQCYQCTTVENKACDDPFRNHDYSPTECSTICVKIRFEGTAISLQCYQCTTVENKACDDPFRNHDYSPTECSTICVKIRFEGTVERGCFNNRSPFPVTSPGGSGCVSQYIPMKGMTTVCRCSTPRCNGTVGNGSLVYLPFLLLGLALALLLHYTIILE